MTRTLEEATAAVEFHQLSIAETAVRLSSDCKHGLSGAEAHTRMQQHGLNKLRQHKPVPGWRRFLRQLQDTLVILLIIAAMIATIVWCIERDKALPYDAVVILS